MLFRKMTIQDYDDVYNLWLNTPGMGLNDVDDSREGIKRYLERNPNTCFLAERNGKVIGVILSGHDGRRGFIHHTAVEITERKHGIATELLNLAMKALEEEGITKVALVVFAKNRIGNEFWDRRGFLKREDLTYRNRNINPLKRIDT